MFLELIRFTFIGILLLLLQFFLVQEINFGTWIKPMPYIYLILILPFQTNKFATLLVAFLLGFVLDSFSDTYGMHASAAVTLAFIKHYSDRWLLDIDAIQLQGNSILVPSWKGFAYFSTYYLVLIFIHHLIFFGLDYFKLSAFFITLAVAFFSTIVTFLFILLFYSISGRK